VPALSVVMPMINKQAPSKGKGGRWKRQLKDARCSDKPPGIPEVSDRNLVAGLLDHASGIPLQSIPSNCLRWHCFWSSPAPFPPNFLNTNFVITRFVPSGQVLSTQVHFQPHCHVNITPQAASGPSDPAGLNVHTSPPPHAPPPHFFLFLRHPSDSVT
jgi:hypothetical protein